LHLNFEFYFAYPLLSAHARHPPAGLTIVDLTRVLWPLLHDAAGRHGGPRHQDRQPGRGDDTRAWGPPFVGAESAYFLSINRNKESLTLDFKDTEGRRILGQLIGKADVVIENFRPGAMARLGLDYATLAPQHPRLVPARSASGRTALVAIRRDTTRSSRPKADWMSVTGDADGPAFRVGVAVTDMVAGLSPPRASSSPCLHAMHRPGQHVDISMLDGVISLLSYHASTYLPRVPSHDGSVIATRRSRRTIRSRPAMESSSSPSGTTISFSDSAERPD
jgi:crotonobetainyl-CoA:carnitine CoA-transferase CaiB-like acyl-CoA transferase